MKTHQCVVSHHYGQYAANLAADLNSNMYNGGQNGQFSTSNENWTASASQWPSAFGSHATPTTTASNAGCRFDLWPQNSDDSPPTPNNNENSAAPASTASNMQRPISPGRDSNQIDFTILIKIAQNSKYLFL